MSDEVSIRVVLVAGVVGDSPLPGRVVGVFEDAYGRLLVCLRVPRNGLWWWEDAPADEPDGADDRWVWAADMVIEAGQIAGISGYRPRYGDWVEATVVGPGRFSVREQAPRRVRVESVEVPREAVRAGCERQEGPCVQPSFPDDPDLERWAVACFDATWEGEWRYAILGRGFHFGWQCDAGAGCFDGIALRVAEAAEPGWLEVTEFFSGSCSWRLGPTLWVRDPEAG